MPKNKKNKNKVADGNSDITQTSTTDNHTPTIPLYYQKQSVGG